MSETVSLNGRILEQQQASIACDDRGLLLADGLFETLRIYQGKAVQLTAHWQRMSKGASMLGITIPCDLVELSTMITQLLKANKQHTTDVGLRITLTRGCGQRGVVPHECGPATFLLNLFSVPELPVPPVRLATVAVRKNELSPLAHIKSLNYLDNILASQYARVAGAQEALLLNTQGIVADTSIANIFMVKQGEIFTPRLIDGALPGIARETILKLCADLSIQCHQQLITMNCLRQADEIFLSNAIRQVYAVTSLDNKKSFAQHPVTERLQKSYSNFIFEQISACTNACSLYNS